MADTLICARWLITPTQAGASPAVLTLPDAAVVVDRQGTITAVGPEAELAARANIGTRIRLDEHILAPGLVNAHTHGAMTLLRGAADDLPLARWLHERVWPIEGALLDEHFVSVGTQLAALEMLLGGTTTCADMYFYSAAAAQAYLSAGLRAVLALPVIDFPTRYAADVEGYLSLGLGVRDRFRDESLLSFCLAPHAPYTVSDDAFARIQAYADELGLGIHTHLHETAQEITDSERRYQERPSVRLARLGALGPGFFAAHCVHFDDVDLALFARYGCGVVHCPSSNLKLASGVAPVSRMLAAGLDVGLGTDGAASNNRLDLFEEMRLAALLAKVAENDATAVDAAQAFTMATLGGARVIGLGAHIGSIEVGKRADLIAVSLASPGMTPLFDPVSHFVYAASRADVSDVWVDGARRVQGGQLHTATGLSTAEAMAQWAPSIASLAEQIAAFRTESRR